MKRITAVFISMTLFGLLITGCSTQTSTVESTPEPTTVTEVKETNVDDTELTQDTLYDLSGFSVYIPKGVRFIKSNQTYL